MNLIEHVQKAWGMRRVTFRTYGMNGEHRRPMFHRFEVKGGVRVLDLIAENVARNNSLLRALMKRGKQ